jgi:tRNA(Ile)-lysidine synthase
VTDLEARFREALAGLGIAPDEPIGIACSGGADSTALLHLAATDQRRRVVALHVDHNVRPGSHLDAVFVAEIAAALGVETIESSIDLELPRGASVEAALRDARYAVLETMALHAGLRVVLTGHTLDDQAETVLLRLIRGDVLDGIAPVRGMFARPLLSVPRADLRSWLEANGIAWREDETNEDERYERNWVRKRLLPLIAERRRGVAGVLARTASSVRDDNEVLDSLAAEIVSSAPVDDAGVFVAGFDGLPPALAARVVRIACRLLGCDPRGAEVGAVRRLEHGHVSCRDVDVWRIGGGLAVLGRPLAVPSPIVLHPSGVFASKDWGVKVSVSSNGRSPVLVMRSRRPGDRVPTHGGHKKVQDVLVDAKVPRPLRGLVPIVADEAQALAVVGAPGGRLEHGGDLILDVEPYMQTWSREMAWTRR